MSLSEQFSKEELFASYQTRLLPFCQPGYRKHISPPTWTGPCTSARRAIRRAASASSCIPGGRQLPLRIHVTADLRCLNDPETLSPAQYEKSCDFVYLRCADSHKESAEADV